MEIDPSGLSSDITNLFTSENRVDTIELFTISRDDDENPLTSYGQISSAEIYLFPDPSIFFSNLSSVYCQDEEPVTIQTRIFTYNGVAGVDSTGFITNGYLLEYDSNASFSSPVYSRINFSEDAINGVPGEMALIGSNPAVPVAASNVFDPGNPFQNGSDSTGFFRITYRTVEQTPARTISQETFEFVVRPKVSAPVVDIVPGSGLDDSGGFDGGRYVFEFCSGRDSIPNINIDIATTPSDNVGLSPSAAYNWYTSNGNLIVKDTSSLDPRLLFASNPATGTSEQNIYVTRTVAECESDFNSY